MSIDLGDGFAEYMGEGNWHIVRQTAEGPTDIALHESEMLQMVAKGA